MCNQDHGVAWAQQATKKNRGIIMTHCEHSILGTSYGAFSFPHYGGEYCTAWISCHSKMKMGMCHEGISYHYDILFYGVLHADSVVWK